MLEIRIKNLTTFGNVYKIFDSLLQIMHVSGMVYSCVSNKLYNHINYVSGKYGDENHAHGIQSCIPHVYTTPLK